MKTPALSQPDLPQRTFVGNRGSSPSGQLAGPTIGAKIERLEWYWGKTLACEAAPQEARILSNYSVWLCLNER